MLVQSLFLASLGPDHKAGKHCEAHLGLDLHQIFRQSIHTSTNLSAHGDSVLGILQQLLQITREGGRGDREIMTIVDYIPYHQELMRAKGPKECTSAVYPT